MGRQRGQAAARSAPAAPARAQAPPPSHSVAPRAPAPMAAPAHAPAATHAPAAHAPVAAAPAASHPPAVTHQAPPPAPAGGMFGGGGGIMGTIVSGMAFGTGSAVAHKAVDSISGAFSGGGSASEAPVQHAAETVAAPRMPVYAGASCSNYQKDLYQCLNENNNSASACQFYFDQLKSCNENSASQGM